MIPRAESNTKNCFLVRDQVSGHELRATNAFKLKIRFQEETERSNIKAGKRTFTTKETNIQTNKQTSSGPKQD